MHPNIIKKNKVIHAYKNPINKSKNAKKIAKIFGNLKTIKSNSPGSKIIVKNLIKYVIALQPYSYVFFAIRIMA